MYGGYVYGGYVYGGYVYGGYVWWAVYSVCLSRAVRDTVVSVSVSVSQTGYALPLL